MVVFHKNHWNCVRSAVPGCTVKLCDKKGHSTLFCAVCIILYKIVWREGRLISESRLSTNQRPSTRWCQPGAFSTAFQTLKDYIHRSKTKSCEITDQNLSNIYLNLIINKIIFTSIDNWASLIHCLTKQQSTLYLINYITFCDLFNWLHNFPLCPVQLK